MPEFNDHLAQLRQQLSPEEWARRQRAADAQAAVAARIEARMARGETERAAIRQEVPADPETTWVARLRRYRKEGRDGLVSRRPAVRRDKKLTAEVLGVIRGLMAENPELRSADVHRRLNAMGIEISDSVVKRALKRLGLAHPQGPAGHRTATKVEVLPLAGAELLRAVDLEVGATKALVHALQQHFEALAECEGPNRDDAAHRDDLGRFMSEYNQALPRTAPELGEKFDSVQLRREGKDLRAMRTANSSDASLRRKVETLVYLPVVIDSPRWDGLRHWQGGALEGLVGVAYMPDTIDKFARELPQCMVGRERQRTADGVGGLLLAGPA